ncbi:translocon-associated protein, alpha subunit [Zopfochytrium polystomum]|nr:translocon-associated protein, alpha subunit [Zopfochytrium polystomum]
MYRSRPHLSASAADEDTDNEAFLKAMDDEIRKGGSDSSGVDLQFTHMFPKNPLNLVRAGDITEVLIGVTNVGKTSATLFAVSGLFSHPQNLSLPLRNLTAQRYNLPLGPKQEATVPFRFIPELEAQDVGLVVYIDYFDNEEAPHRAIAYKGVITITAADSTFDLAGLSLIALLGAGGYYLFKFLAKQYFPETVVKKTRPSAAVIREEIEAKKAVLDDDWIPEHVRKADGAKKPSK